jgi:NADPH:quinone reductase-like Zn-dependent oxidoreductase
MKAVVVHEYGVPDVLKFEEYPDPVAGTGEVLVRVAATSINPFDIMRRSGVAKEVAPIKFPGVVGVDLSGIIIAVGSEVEGFSVGDQVFGMADQTYAELCAVKAAGLAKIPEELDVIGAAALPLVTTTGNQLVTLGAGVKAGQTVLITGAVGNVGRSAVFKAKALGAVVIVGVLKSQLAAASSLGANQVVATDDEGAMAALPPLDAVADTVGGKTAAALLPKLKKGGVFASVLGVPQNANDYPSIKAVAVYTQVDTETLLYMTRAVRDGKLVIPIGRKMPLKSAAEGHAVVAKGGAGKIVLVVDEG